MNEGWPCPTLKSGTTVAGLYLQASCFHMYVHGQYYIGSSIVLGFQINLSLFSYAPNALSLCKVICMGRSKEFVVLRIA